MREVKQIRSKNKGDMIKREHKIKSKEVWLWGKKTQSSDRVEATLHRLKNDFEDGKI